MAETPMRSSEIDTYPPPESGPVGDVATDLEAIHGNLFDGEAIDATFRGEEPGMQLLAITSRRLMMVESTTHDGYRALTSVPFGRVMTVSFLASGASPLGASHTVGFSVMQGKYRIVCRNTEEARQAHDLLIWTITTE